MYGRMTGFRINELTHQDSATMHVSECEYFHDVRLTSNVTGVEYCLGVVFDEEHDRASTVICLNTISTVLLQARETYV